ncbi:ABC transporter permease [Weissella diestrammenae]|uniref:ABC transporter permease n=1 Tax=Weissella diestrammenae TaxID=1162633 RepID=A0A7G9T535_9LACO|nr:ABC transporter permease [Weissella diestrammenae]MCM0583064.1 ABC transporter permease [Weissella diestrammenae]QNN75210.1 ABC transporter permease [Weissella diestrammenae]
MTFLNEHFIPVINKIGQQLWLVIIATCLGILIALPLGILVSRNKRVARIVMPVVITLQTIPSLALLALLVPFMGIGAKTAIFALALYALLPILQNTVVGIQQVPASLNDVALALGLTPLQRLIKVSLPLALPLIMQGIRLSTVYVISWSTLAAYIGAGGLGDYIFAGLNLYDPKLILLGTLPLMLLAIFADSLLKLATRILVKRFHVDEVIA